MRLDLVRFGEVVIERRVVLRPLIDRPKRRTCHTKDESNQRPDHAEYLNAMGWKWHSEWIVADSDLILFFAPSRSSFGTCNRVGYPISGLDLDQFVFRVIHEESSVDSKPLLRWQ